MAIIYIDTMKKEGIWIFKDSEEFIKALSELQKQCLHNDNEKT